MSIQDTYREFLLQEIIQEILREGATPSIAEIELRFNSFISQNNISKPLFIFNNNKVSYGIESSASLYNQTNNEILRDLRVLYTHLFKISDQSISSFDRWRSQIKLLEGRLDSLLERVNSLLITSSDTAGFLNFVQDNFSDTSKVDSENTTAYVNIDKGLVSLGTNSIGPTRIDLSEVRDDHVEFNLLTKKNVSSVNVTSGSRTKNVVTDVTNFWHERIYTTQPGPFSAEIKINLLREYSISRIDIDLHSSNQNSTMQVTPLLSMDNFNYIQLPIDSFTRSISDKSSFRFPAQQAKFIKLLMTKVGFDQVQGSQYCYEFGIDEVAFYREAFSAGSESTLISKSLSIINSENLPEPFSKVVLEVCEEIPESTRIDYFIGVSNSETEPLASGMFIPIDPIDRELPTKPVLLDFAELGEVSISGLLISYDPADTTISGTFINPAKDYLHISSITGSSPSISTIESSDQRYLFNYSNERILNYSFDPDINITPNTLELWRNVFILGSLNKKVRGISGGWGFEEPYYKTTVKVNSETGYEIDFGNDAVVINESLFVGKTTLSAGIHRIWIHKDNWKEIDSSLVTDLASLKSADTLYPYNQKYLIEGYAYPTSWPTIEEKAYRGFDIVGELLMKEIPIFDFVNNIQITDYSRFAIDLDLPDNDATIDSVAGQDRGSNKVFAVQVNENNSDFLNEVFLLKFKVSNSTFKFLRLKAILSTEDTDITPFFDSYRIKVSS